MRKFGRQNGGKLGRDPPGHRSHQHLAVRGHAGGNVDLRHASLFRSRLATTIITVEEQMRGWLALIHRSSDARSQIPAYERLLGMIDFFFRWKTLQFDARAAAEFERLRKKRIRMGTMDLKIAAIALANNALLLSRNLRDFQRISELRVENWLV